MLTSRKTKSPNNFICLFPQKGDKLYDCEYEYMNMHAKIPNSLPQGESETFNVDATASKQS